MNNPIINFTGNGSATVLAHLWNPFHSKVTDDAGELQAHNRILGGLYHIYYLTLTRRGRGELVAIAPSMLDVRQAIQNLAYYTWRRKEHVDFRRYDYTQKAEYWALVWGTILMAVTGIILWFPGLMTRFLPIWAVTASQTVHYYEAWLAVLAIVVWHLFFVLFHPDEYPMNWTWLTGKMTERAERESIATMGLRGEALGSSASISRMNTVARIAGRR